ncbi:hypothetical protein [Priestia megaterium]|uniref:hypothetical protein n=1 Tax=Priestia megaterium TaxID=1404 RepID=UPI0023DA6A93|nr:hypothetical protein [Priestia megaterium]MDF2053259.1 hypothetical protein [Priestia megaterium]MDF2062651.1 hypothetical protein [Priestia megaterium]
MITIEKYDCHYNKKSNSQQKDKKQKREKVCIHINIYNHAETGGQISGNGGQNANQGGQIAQTGGQNANQDGVVVKKCGKKNKETKVKKINFEDDMK